ncbi:MAG: hypothetical protein KDD98_10700 [Sphingomonadaceae bacterium]|nr:hypothetical protein [Sphingomonadaceae bacterium]
MRLRMILAAALATALAGCATTAPAGNASEDLILSRMLSGQSVLQGKELEEAMVAASAYPLGSRENPVRASRPQGQRAYLGRLKCADGSAPAFTRTGNLGPGVYGNIIDNYRVTCLGADGKEKTVNVVMDMYHAGFVETRPVPGFTIEAP